MKTSELLRKAADEIRRRGWHQGDYENEATGAVCSYGAVNAAATGAPWVASTGTIRARGYLMRQVGTRRAIATWNDAEGRTVEEVLEKFEEAARAAEREGD